MSMRILLRDHARTMHRTFAVRHQEMSFIAHLALRIRLLT